jgi:LysR family transcriptional regulator, hydrogen peroxide-inducible genes activator
VNFAERSGWESFLPLHRIWYLCFLRSFVKQNPHVDLVFEELLTKELLEKLGNDQLDAGITATPSKQSYIYTEDLFVEPFVAYLSHNHPLIEKEKLTVDDLDRTNIWLLNEGHCFRDQAVKLCKEMKKENPAAIEFKSGNLETLKKLVEQNFGMTLLPWTAVREFDSNCANAIIKEFEDPVPSRKVRLVYSEGNISSRPLSPHSKNRSAMPFRLN